MTYSLEMFGNMFVDHVRHDAYVAALTRSIRQGDVVVDIGTGIGVYAMLAAQLGARRVYAIEINPLIQLGPQLAQANGLADRIEFIQALSTEIDLPEPADVVFADLRGTTPFYNGNISSMYDARQRLLAPGGILIPKRDRIMAALSTNPYGAQLFRGHWLDNPFNFDLSLVAQREANLVRKDLVKAKDLLCPGVEIATIDYGASDETDFAYEGAFTTTASGTADGFSLWFDAQVLDDIRYSTHPAGDRTVYGMTFLPFERAVEVSEGTRVDVHVSARLADGDYVWRWGATGEDRDGEPFHIEHSSFDATPVDLAAVHRRKASYRLPANPTLDVDLEGLRLLAAGHTLGETATELVRSYPARFPDFATALTRAADLAAPYATKAKPAIA